MQPKNKKSVLILIIVLMIIVIPCSIWGTINHFTASNKSDNNVNKEFHYNNKLYFYNVNNLLGTYTCTNSVCDYAYGTIDDSSYALRYHQVTTDEQIKLVNNRYAFIVDTTSSNAPYKDANVILYDVVGGRNTGTFSAVKNYAIGLENNQYIIKNMEGLWGVVALNDTPSLIIPYSYNYIGIHDVPANNSTSLETDTYVVKDTTGWKLISNQNVDLTSYFNYPIYDYNSKYVAVKNNDYYFLYDYSNNLVVSFGYKNIKFMGEYIGVLNSNNQFYVINPTTTADLSKKYTVNSLDDVSYTISSNGLTLSINNIVVETIK